MKKEECLAPPKRDVSRAEAKADAAIVERIVRRGWAGFETMTETRRVDFTAIFAELARWIDAQPEPIAVDALFAELTSVLAPAGDNHMAFFHFTPKGHARRKSVGSHEDAYTADLVVVEKGTTASRRETRVVLEGPHKGARVVSCEGSSESLFRRTVTDALTAAFRPIVLARTAPPPLRCTIANGSKEETIELPMRPLRVDAPVDKNASAFEMVRSERELVPAIKLRSMWSGKLSELEAFVATAPRLRDAKSVVVDVRGNGGGSNTYAKEWFKALTNGKLTPTVVDRLDSDVTRQGIYNDTLCELAEGFVTDEAAKKEIADRLSYASMMLDTAQRQGELFRRWQSRTFEEVGAAPKAFEAPIVVLTDKQCVSACESFLTMTKHLDKAIVVGENSGGSGVFAEVLVYRLPKSGLGMTAGMKHFHHADPSKDIPEGRGLLPDVWLDTTDSLGLTTKIAECLAKSSPRAPCPLAAALIGR